MGGCLTIIVTFVELGVALADLLVTVDGPGPWDYLPSVGEPGPHVQGLPLHPSRLARKVAKLSLGGQTTPFLIAGSVGDVEAFLDDARDLGAGAQGPSQINAPLVRHNLASVAEHAVARAKQRGGTDVRLLGLRGNLTLGISPLDRHYPYFGRVLLAGSGAPALDAFLRDRSTQYEALFPRDPDEMKTYRVAHYLPMQLLNADRDRPSSTLAVGVGGFYEVLFNVKGRLDDAGGRWVRILAEIESASTAIVHALWYHEYDHGDLIVLSAPSETLRITTAASALLPIERLRAHRYGAIRANATKPAPMVSHLLPRVHRARMHTASFRIASPDRLLTTMGTRSSGPFLVTWRREGLDIALNLEKFTQMVQAAQS